MGKERECGGVLPRRTDTDMASLKAEGEERSRENGSGGRYYAVDEGNVETKRQWPTSRKVVADKKRRHGAWEAGRAAGSVPLVINTSGAYDSAPSFRRLSYGHEITCHTTTGKMIPLLPCHTGPPRAMHACTQRSAQSPLRDHA